MRTSAASPPSRRACRSPRRRTAICGAWCGRSSLYWRTQASTAACPDAMSAKTPAASSSSRITQLGFKATIALEDFDPDLVADLDELDA